MRIPSNAGPIESGLAGGRVRSAARDGEDFLGVATSPVRIPDDMDLVEVVHRGSRTVVLRCRIRESGDRVLVKTPSAAIPDGRELARYRHEAGLLARGIPGVVRVRGLVELGGRPHLVLDDGGGQSLDVRLREGPLEIRDVIRILASAGEVLQRVHDAGIVHKDVTPGNLVRFPDRPGVELIDFGTSTTVSREQAVPRPATELEGTLLYLAPEQTGRMNRGVDWRADLYGLGATAWHLLAGEPVFALDDPLELVHAHLARRPRAPHEVRPEVPPALSAIVLKLLAKEPEDRYQSAAGLAADAVRCLLELEAGGLGSFAVGLSDRSQRFAIPGRVYGRDSERETLLAAFAASRSGAAGLLLVTGPPGIGKSTMVAELRGPVTEGRGCFASGRFEQLRREVPYLAFLSAIGHLLRQILTESEASLAGRRERVRDALGPSAGLLVRVLPELAPLVERDSDELEPEPEQLRSRMRVAFAALLRALAEPERPVVLFLDDLQWADAASLELLEFLAADPGLRGLLLVGGYRAGEVGPAHPLVRTIESLSSKGRPARTLVAGPLDADAATRLVADACRSSEETARPLASLLLEKTGGNPFFLRALLERLHADGHIRPSPSGWTFDAAALEGIEVTDNVVQLLIEEIGRLPAESRDALRTAACLGHRFRAGILATILGRPGAVVGRRRDPAVAAGLLVPEDDAYRLVAYREDGDAWVRFAHDRVEEASYALLPEGERPALHAAIGRVLLARGGEEDALFEVVGHFGRAEALLDGPERERFAELALAAGRQAAGSGAFELAWSFYESGLGALGETGWDRRYELALDLASGAAETALFVGRREAMERRVDEVLARARTLEDGVTAWSTRLRARIADNRMLEAVEVSDQFLTRAGRPQPRTASPPAILWSLARTALAIGRRKPEDLLDLPEARDPLARAVQKIQIMASTPQVAAMPHVIPLAILRDVRAVLRDGVTAEGAQCWTGYALLLIVGFGRHALANRYGELALAQVERLGRRDLWPRMAFIVYAVVRPWTTAMAEIVAPLRSIYARALEVGDLTIAVLGASMADLYAFHSGATLDDLRPQMEGTVQAIAQHGIASARAPHAELVRSVRILLDPAGADVRHAPTVSDDASAAIRFEIALNDLHRALLFGDPAAALEIARRDYASLDTPARPATHVVYWTYSTVALLAAVERGLVPRREVARRIRRGRQDVRAWAKAVRANAYRTHWVDAADARSRGKASAALERYERAIEEAWSAGARHDAALIAEQAGEYSEALGRRRNAEAFFREAHAAYRQWGARAKVARLETDRAAELGVVRGGAATSITRTTTTSSGAQLDLRSVLKASQAMSEEIVTERLLARIMSTLIENAGAVRGVLVLERPGGATVEAEARVGEPAVAARAPLAEARDLPVGLVNCVLRTGESVVLGDAARDAGPFGQDPWIVSRRPRSLVCVPIVRGGTVQGAVFLENGLVADCFTPERLETIRLLSGQAAISIENAALYAGVEERVRERTAELEVRNRFIRQIFGRYVSQEIVDSLLEDQQGLRMGGELRRVTILMADLRGFTSFSTRHPPQQVVRVLNTYLSRMTEVVLDYRGTIDEVLGDAMLVIFGAPILHDDDAERALACAVAMQLAMIEVNQTLAAEGLPAVEMGIGITSGEVVVGNIGSERRAKYGVVGPPVNLAGRIESYSTGGQILAAESTCEGVPDLEIADVLEIAAKGFDQPLRVYQVTGVGGRHGLRLGQAGDDLVRLPEPRPIRIAVQEGKHGTGEVVEARLVALGTREAEIEDVPLAVRTDVRIWLDDEATPIYAKILRATGRSVVARFTSILDEAKTTRLARIRRV